MHASECRRYAELCLQLARELGPQHRAQMQDMAAMWRKAADALERPEGRINGFTEEADDRS
jgi:hypothetical protein